METKEAMEVKVDEFVFEFANKYEFLLWAGYCKTAGITVPTTWRQPENYNKILEKGSQLYEKRKISQAMEVYRQALQMNPVAIVARFEIAQCYIVLKQYMQAKSFLLESAGYFQGKEAAAHFYRKMGFIAVEERNWKLGMACYQKSCEILDTPLAESEIKFITSRKGPDILGDKSPEFYIKKAGIPVMTIFLDDTGLHSETRVDFVPGD